MRISDLRLMKELQLPRPPIPQQCCIETEEVDIFEEGTSDDDEEEVCYDDNDFWEAIDLLEVSRKHLTSIRKHLPDTLEDMIIDHFICDISNFLSYFVDNNEEGDRS